VLDPRSMAPIFTRPTDTRSLGLWQLIRSHIEAKFVDASSVAWVARRSMAFHVVYYKKIHRMSDESVRRGWPFGPLYNSGHKIAVKACTIFAAFASTAESKMAESDQNTDCSAFGTTVYLIPEGFHGHQPTQSFRPFVNQTVAVYVLSLIREVLTVVASEWGNLMEEFDDMFDNKKVFLDPKSHDDLLIDDQTFSRSRKYFWALSCLDEFSNYINNTCFQWETSRLIWERELPMFDPQGWPAARELMISIDLINRRLREHHRRCETHHARVSGLRDGLFNASAVMESRASTKLSENVKLLTFISIFFLPLSFCTSLWSISNDIFTLEALIYTIIFVALATYLATFNMNRLVIIFNGLYESQRQNLVAMMSSDASAIWKSRGARFESSRYQPRTEVMREPSEWLVALYAIIRSPSLIRIGLGKLRKKRLRSLASPG